MSDDHASQIDKTVKKYKKRLKRIMCCGIVWTVIAVLSLIIGIIMLVYFAQYWPDETNWRRGLAYFGAVLLIIFIVSFVIGVVFFVVLRILYKRMDNPKEMKMFKPPSYSYGEAPYPQQPPEPGSQNASPTHALQPNAPGAQPSAPPQGMQEIQIEVDDHKKF